MFIIKAELSSTTPVSAPAGGGYSMFQAHRVAVSKSTMASCGSPGHPCPPDPELEVRLFDEQNNCHEVLYVGHGLDHFCAVYIMNERGKTVDSVYPGPAEPRPTTSRDFAFTHSKVA